MESSNTCNNSKMLVRLEILRDNDDKTFDLPNVDAVCDVMLHIIYTLN